MSETWIVGINPVAGAVANDPDGVSPNEPTSIVGE